MPSSQPFRRELDMNGAERHGRPSNVARRVRAGARIQLWPAAGLGECRYDIAKNVFPLPALARWKSSPPSAKLPAGRQIPKGAGRLVHPSKITGKLIDDALEALERENLQLKNVLNKNRTQLQTASANLAAPSLRAAGDRWLISASSLFGKPSAI